MRFRIAPFALLLAITLVAACESVEDRAEAFYKRGLELIEEGDVDRAIVELRNVFQLNGGHREARWTLANLLLNEKQNLQGAYSQFLRLAEQYPDDLETRVMLGELAFTANNWDELERHGAKAQELAADDPRVQVLTSARSYRDAVVDKDEATRREQVRVVDSLLQTQPDNEILRQLRIDNLLRDGQLREALVEVDWILERRANDLRLLNQRANILAQLQDYEALEVHLRDMIARFPEDATHKTNLIRYFAARQDTDAAEEFLRSLVAAAEPGDIGPRVELVRFLTQLKGLDAARAEVVDAIAQSPDEPRFKILSASLQYQAGERDAAIMVLERALADVETGEIKHEMQVALARMLLGTGNLVGARAQVEQVLNEDPEHVNALKLQAAWLIEADETDIAIAGLRVALEKASEDVEAMTLMSQAYMRAGQRELARDFMSLAVDASGNAVGPTVRYTNVLIEDENYLAAEDILLPALRRNPGNFELLQATGRLYTQMEDFGRLEQVIQSLRALDTPEAERTANGLEAERINRQSGPDDAIQYLEGIARAADASLNSKITLVRARLSTGDASGALTLARELYEQEPENIALKGVMAAVASANGLLDEAEQLYRDILEQNPQGFTAWLELSRIKARQGDKSGARDTIKAGLDVLPENANLLWAQASNFELDGNYEGAIEIYETLYERNSNSVVISNNLASLLSTYRTDEDSLERAWLIARRMKDTDIPAMQDTYGWILQQRGSSEEALPYLESAARNLPNQPLVYYHLAETYHALGRIEDALESYRRAVSLAGPADQRAQIVKARQQASALEKALVTSDN